MTISPPAKVKSEEFKPFQVLASGIDTLVLAIDVFWKNNSFFQYLETMKELAKKEDKDCAIAIKGKDEVLWHGTIKPYGAKGYEWVINGSDFSLTIGNWLEPKSRPSIMAQIHSETLWRLGPQLAVELLLFSLTQSGAEIKSAKISRVDICVDFFFPEKDWVIELIKYHVTRARKAAPYLDNMKLTGINIGKNNIVARLYDKPLEIKQQSKKDWMYEVWGIESVPKDLKIIRVEFQLRREVIKEVGLD